MGGGKAVVSSKQRLQYFGQRRVEEAVSAKLREQCHQQVVALDSVTEDAHKQEEQAVRSETADSSTQALGGSVTRTLSAREKPPQDAQPRGEMRQGPVLLGSASRAHFSSTDTSKFAPAYLRELELRLGSELMSRAMMKEMAVSPTEVYKTEGIKAV